jgi:hypothetical protein
MIITTPCKTDPFGNCSQTIESPKDISSMWDTPKIVAGDSLTLRQIHQILRTRNSTANVYPFDPRIHAAVACGSISCPDLARFAYEPLTLDEKLNSQMGIFLMHFKKGMSINREKIEVTLNKIFDWYEIDFELAAVTTVNFISQGNFSLPRPDVEYLKSVANTDYLTYKYFDFDWGLNGWIESLGRCDDRSCFPLWALLLTIFGTLLIVFFSAALVAVGFFFYRRQNSVEVI